MCELVQDSSALNRTHNEGRSPAGSSLRGGVASTSPTSFSTPSSSSLSLEELFMAPSLPTEVPVASTSITAIPEPAVAATSSPAVASSFMTSPGAVAATAAGTLSKSAAKRLAKQAIWEETKGARRQREKERKAARKAAVLEQIAAGDTELEASQRERAERQREKNNLKHRFDWKASPATGLKAPKSEAEWFQARCVVDLGFDELMMEKVRLKAVDSARAAPAHPADRLTFWAPFRRRSRAWPLSLATSGISSGRPPSRFGHWSSRTSTSDSAKTSRPRSGARPMGDGRRPSGGMAGTLTICGRRRVRQGSRACRRLDANSNPCPFITSQPLPRRPLL